MTSRWKKGRPSAVLQQQNHRILELEILLNQKDEAIANLEKKLKEQLQTVKKLRRDREELRDKNASLVGKLAEVCRKNSIANLYSTGSTPPTKPRLLLRTSTSKLPDLPESPDLHNGTPSSSEGTPDTPARTKLPAPHPQTQNSVAEDPDSDTDFEDIEEADVGRKKKEDKAPLAKQGAMDAKIDSEIAAVLKTQEKTSPASKWRGSSSPPLYSRQRHSSSESSTSSSFGSGGSREGSYRVSSDRPRMQKIESSERLASKIRQMIPRRPSQSSQEGGVTGGPPRRTSTPNQGDGTKVEEKSGNSYLSGWLVVQKNGSSSTPLSNGAGDETSSAKVEGDTEPERNGIGRIEEKVEEKAKKKTTFSATSEIIPVPGARERGQVGTENTESTSSDYPNSDVFHTDNESSVEVFSPTPLSSKEESSGFARTIHKSMPDLDLGVVQRLTAIAKTVPLTENRRSAALDDMKLEEEDKLDELGSFGPSNVRSRTQTLSSLTGGKRRMELGRKRVREHKLDMKRFSSVSTATGISKGEEPCPRDRASTIHELELLSPILEAKIRNMKLKKIYAKYGGKDVVTKAVDVIATAYQTYRLEKRFLERQKEKRENRTMQRKRAQSLRQPNRRPSIMSKNRRQYRQEKDPILKTTEAAERLAKERVPHAHSGARLELMEKRRSESNLMEVTLKETEVEQDEEDEEEEGGVEQVTVVKRLIPALSISQIKVDFGMQDEDEGSSQEIQTEDIVFTLSTAHNDGQTEGSVALQDKPDGIVGSESAQSLSSPNRLSIFSTSSMESSVAEYSSSSSLSGSTRSFKANTLPHPSRINKKEVKKEVDMKLMTGIYYFNKKPVKGIQYLIRNSLLEDDPRGVADFFIHQKGLSKEKIGEFLGEINSEFNMAVLESIVGRSNMGDKPIDEALREFQQLFRMPGEAQKIDKIMEVFALEYYLHNKSLGIFKSEDSAYILSFAIMMLHTSLHNPSVKSRTSKKQWVSMNRGNNDGENFREGFLLEIFDRIQATEFATGKDHTHRVAEIEKQIIGLPIQKLSVSYRYLVLRMSTSEVQELGVRPGFRNKHRRVLFFFNDIAVICKRKHNEYMCKETFSLLNVLPVKFESQHYKYGVQLHAVDKETPYQFNCDTSSDREQLLRSLETITQHLRLLESERITALGTTLTNRKQDDATDRASLVCDAGDLISSKSLASRSPSIPPSKHRDDFVPGVGDLVTTSLPANYNIQNRISRDSGFSSQQLTPTPPHSPSLAEVSPAYATPTISPTGSFNALAAPPIKTSKSTEFTELKLPTSSPNRSPSMDFLRRRKSTPAASANNVSPLLDVEGRAKKKDRGTSDKTHKKGKFSFGKTKVKDSSDGGKSKVKNLSSREASASPQAHRKLEQNCVQSYDGSSLESSLLSSLTTS